MQQKTKKKLVIIFLIFLSFSFKSLIYKLVQKMSNWKIFPKIKIIKDNTDFNYFLNFGLPINQIIPFKEQMIFVYSFLFLIWINIISLIFMFLYIDNKILKKIIIINISFALIAFLFFVSFPFQLNETFLKQNLENIQKDSYSFHFLNLLYEKDKPGINLIPSMHASCSWLCFIIFRYQNNKGKNKVPKKVIFIQLFFSLLIFYSTIAIRQHGLLDLLIAILLIELIFFIIIKCELKKIIIKKKINLNLERLS
jgi:membrane-associated phospholipid phosphatase